MSPSLPYKVTFVATYHCNFRCEMCNIWQKKSVNEMTPDEVGLFFERWSQFSWVHLTGGELFMRRDLDDLVAAIQKSCRSLFLLNFPTTGWFGDKTVSLVERTLARGVGRLMVTISLDGPKALHEEMRGLPGSFDRGDRDVPPSARHPAIEFPDGHRDDADGEERGQGRRRRWRRSARSSPTSSASELHLNVGHESGHYFDNLGYADARRITPTSCAPSTSIAARSAKSLHPVRFLEDRYQALIGKYYETHKSPLPCTALSSSCFIDAYWNLFACSIWDEKVGNLRETGFDLRAMWDSQRRKDLREEVVGASGARTAGRRAKPIPPFSEIWRARRRLGGRARSNLCLPKLCSVLPTPAPIHPN